MYFATVFILANLFALLVGHDINYCGAKMCGNTDAHTFCQFSTGPSPHCAGYIPAALSQEEKSRILARLNRRRDDAAAGRLRRLPSAANMLKLRWVGELAREAQLWANRCRPPKTPEELDACRDLYSVSVGQCVASVVGEAPGLRVESMVDIWFMQNMLYKGNITMYEPPEPGKRFYGDFAQMMWARTYMVGCGRSRFMVLLRGRLRTVERLVCNFAPQGPPPYRPLWTPGVPAAACPSRSRPYTALTSLCDYQYELNLPDDIDNSKTMEEHILLNAVLEIEKNATQHESSLDETYLKYLAIVTMENIEITSPRYNSIQKRDTIEQIDLYEENSGMMSDLKEHLNITTKAQTEKINIINFTKKKPKLMIGRPKSYNVEELSDIGGDQKEKNDDSNERLSKLKKEFYEEYNIESTEDIASTPIVHESIENNLNGTVTPKYREDEKMLRNTSWPILSGQTEMIAYLGPTDQLNNLTKYESSINASINLNINNSASYIETTTPSDKILDDYLSDPETVRQLQEALDRMEREASAANVSKNSAKVRRELRNIPPAETNANELPAVPDEVIIPESDVVSTLSPDEEYNKTLERGPMLNMVMKYMPYLKNYETGMLGPANSANCGHPAVGQLLITLFIYLTVFSDV